MNIPEKIKVGYQNNKKSNNKLAFVLPSNDNNPIFDTWIDKDYGVDIFINEYVSNFRVLIDSLIIHKTYYSEFKPTKYFKKLRVYDPRGWEIEISIEQIIQFKIDDLIDKDGLFKCKLKYRWSNDGNIELICNSDSFIESNHDDFLAYLFEILE